jgi:Leucine-rich repeat (LRR) protein
MDLKRLLKLLERCSDWIETERINPALSDQGDPLPEKYRGPVDRYGRPKRDDENAVKTKNASQRKREGLEKRDPSRVLLWSKRGDNRACMVAAAYLIKRFGMNVHNALQIVAKNIPEMRITPGHMWALECFSQRHTLGLLLCEDCIENAVDDIQEMKISRSASRLSNSILHANSSGSNTPFRSPASTARSLAAGSATGSPSTPRSDPCDSPVAALNDTLNDASTAEAVGTKSRRGSQVKFSMDLNETFQLDQDPSVYVASAEGSFDSRSTGPSNDGGRSNITSLGSRESDSDASAGKLSIGSTGLPFAKSREERNQQEAHIKAIAAAEVAKRAATLDKQVSASSDASNRFRRRRRRSRFPNEQYDDLEARAAGCPALVDLCREGIFEILPLCSVPQHVCSHETYRMLCDLDLPGRGLGDATLMLILKDLDALGVGKQLRLVNLSNNNVGDDGVRTLCGTVWPDFEEMCYGPLHKENQLAYGQYPNTQLSVLLLQNNRFGVHGATHLANLLRFTGSVMTLDVSNNDLSDHGCHSLLHVMVKPGQEFEDDSDKDDEASRTPSIQGSKSSATSTARANFAATAAAAAAADAAADDDDAAATAAAESTQLGKSTDTRPYNRSIVDLRITNIGLGTDSAVTLTNLMSRTQTIYALCIDANMNMGPRGLKNILRAIKITNRTLSELSMNDVKMLPSHLEMLLGILEDGLCPLRRLSLARCGLAKLHMSKMDGALAAAKHLTHLDLSGNNLGDEGAKFLAEEMFTSTGHRHGHHRHGHGHDHQHGAGVAVSAHYGNEDNAEEEEEEMRLKRERVPLVKLELCSCGLGKDGVRALLDALRFKTALTHLDLSENDFSDKEASAVLAEGVRRMHLKELHLDLCRLGTMGARKVLRTFTPGAPVRIDAKDTLGAGSTYSAVSGPSLSPGGGGGGGGGGGQPKSPGSTSGPGFLGLSDPFGTLENYKSVGPEGSVESLGLAGGDSLTLATEPTLPPAELEAASRAVDAIRVLSLSGNDVHNPVGKDLFWLLERNMNLAFLDMGFNNITDAVKKHVVGSLTVVSTSSDDKKLRDLHINMVGNPCDQSLFETPSLTRSKVTFQFALSGGSHSHVPKQEVDAFKQRLEYSLQSHRANPTPIPNFIP